MDRAITQSGDDLVGIVDSEPPLAPPLKQGGLSVFNPDDIADWMYFDGGRMVGNPTMRAMLATAASARDAFSAGSARWERLVAYDERR